MKRKIFPGLVIAGLTSILISGCSSTAHIEKDDTANFNSYHSFSWLETKKDPKNDLAEKKITSAVSAELIKAGWKQNNENPDVYLNYDISVDRNIKESEDPVYSRPSIRYLYNPYTRRVVSVYFPSTFLGYDHNEYTVREGTVTITMVDARTNKAVWQGWSTDQVNSKNLTSREIQSAVRSIFKKSDLAKN